MSRQSQLQFVVSNGRELVLVNPELGHAMTMGSYYVTSTAEDYSFGGAKTLNLRIQSNGPVRTDWITPRELERIMANLFQADQLSIEELLNVVHRKMEDRR